MRRSLTFSFISSPTPRHRIISIATIVEKQQQGIHYKMKYILDPKLDDYVRLYHETPHFYIIATVLLVHKD